MDRAQIVLILYFALLAFRSFALRTTLKSDKTNNETVDCSALDKPRVVCPFCSPPAVHSFLANFFRGKYIVEIGTHSGDGINCYAQFVQSAFVIAGDRENGEVFKGREGASNCRVICGYFPVKLKGEPTGFPSLINNVDVVTLWRQEHLGYPNVARALAQAAESGNALVMAEAIFPFDPKIAVDMAHYNKFKPNASWEKNIEFDESKAAKSMHVGEFLLGRASGSFKCLRTSPEAVFLFVQLVMVTWSISV